VRYPDGGGLTATGRTHREQVRLHAAALFEQAITPIHVAQALRVSTKSAYQWHRRWQAGGTAALASTGPGGNPCRLTPAQQARLATELDDGPAAHGWNEDQRWTLARVTRLIGRLFHVSYTPRGTSYLLHRMGWSPQVPTHRAVERNEDAITAWRTQTWAKVRG
jgi:putative transposase